jgi:membrane protease YdiL (CAAX protease family)
VTGQKLTSGEKRALALWVLAGIVGVVFAYKYYFQAFPEASVNFKISRSEVLNRARDFVTGLGGDLGGYRSAVAFDVNENAKTYLERELGLQRANEIMASEVSVWYWDVRFFKPLEEEEYHVRVSPGGQVVGYRHHIPEAQVSASLEQTAALRLAEKYLETNQHVNLSDWNFLADDANETHKPNRIDWGFTWEKKDFRAKDAPDRLSVTVQGTAIGDSTEYLKVPEAWERSFKQLRSGNDTLALAFTIPYLLLLGAAVWLGIKLTQTGQTRWKPAIWVGVLAATLLILQNLNDWPLWGSSYDTTQSYGSFIALKIGLAILVAGATAVTITLALPAAEPLYRASQPGRVRLYELFTMRGVRTREFFSSAVVGLCLAAAHIGYVVGFYVVAGHFGAWAPQDISYEESVNTLFPWISGAAIGLLAATNEEFTFRLFAIPFFKRVTGLRWIAVILPAFLWSFLHSNYPQEPAYIRGIEIGLIGIVAGLVMLRWGILATLIWHYTVDASLVGLLLIRSNSMYFRISGVVVALAAVAPLLFSAISYLARGGFEEDSDLLNERKPVDLTLGARPVRVPGEAATARYRPLSRALVGGVGICVAIGGLAVWKAKTPGIGDYLRLSTHPASVRAISDALMRQRGLNPNAFHHSVTLVDITDPSTNEYLRERVGIPALNRIYESQVPGALWRVRYFRDRQAEEFAVILRPDGSMHSFHHVMAEDAPGASLAKEDAIRKGETYLKEKKGIDLAQWKLVEATSDKRPHRVDYMLTWQANRALDEDTKEGSASDAERAYKRIELQVLGDEATSFRTYIKIPEEWRRKHEELSLGRVFLSWVLPIGLLLGGTLTVLVLFLKNLKSEAAKSIPWRRILWWSGWGLAAYAVAFFLGNRIPALLAAYDTAIPLKAALGILAVGFVVGGPLYLGLIALLFGMAWYFALGAVDRESLPAWAKAPGAYYRDALLIGIGGAIGFAGLMRLLGLAGQLWPTAHRLADASFGQDLDAILPAGAVFASAILRGLVGAGLICAIAAFIAGQAKRPWLRALLFVLAAVALVGGSWGSPEDFAKQLLARIIQLGAVALGVRYVMRINALGCVLAIVFLTLLQGAGEMLRQADSFYRLNGYALVLLLLAVVSWPLLKWIRQAGGAGTAGTAQFQAARNNVGANPL